MNVGTAPAESWRPCCETDSESRNISADLAHEISEQSMDLHMAHNLHVARQPPPSRDAVDEGGMHNTYSVLCYPRRAPAFLIGEWSVKYTARKPSPVIFFREQKSFLCIPLMS